MSDVTAMRCYSGDKCIFGSVSDNGRLCHYWDVCREFTPSEEMRKAMEEIMKEKEEKVDHPSHYQGDHECIELMRAMFGNRAIIGFCKCNSFKYRFRAGKKDGENAEDDISKAEWYENYLMKMYKEGVMWDE